MKILIAKFQLESNEHVPMMCDLENTALSFGKDAIAHMQLGSITNNPNVELIPVLCADAACSGVMKQNAFLYLENRILDAIKDNLNDLDGIYFHLHGASEIENLGSGEHHLIKEVRKIVGPYFPIAVSCDPHGNLSKEYVENCTIIRSYRESPHIDIAETVEFVTTKLVQLIQDRKDITPVYQKLPMILGGEQSVSTDEPVKSLNLYMNDLEKDDRILSISWHVGYLRHDTPVAGCGIVVVPSDNQYREYAAEICNNVSQYIWNKRHEFHYTGLTLSPVEALEKAINFGDKPVFITDSGDNVTSGAMGANTFILHQFNNVPALNKRVLFAAIHDKKTCYELLKKETGEKTHISLGMGIDDLTKKIELDVIVKYKGHQEGTYMYGEKGDYGPLVTVSVVNKPIDIVITDNNHSFVEKHQLFACGIDWDNYDIIVVKQGYIHPEEKAKGKLCIMSLTDGATPQDTKLIKFKQILRPIFPIDEI